MDGLELLQNLRQSGNNIPFIMFTGKGREEEVEKKRAEDKLAEVEKERQIILDSVPAMMFFKDRDSNFSYVNKRLADVYGMNPADFMGKSTREIFPAEAEAHTKTTTKSWKVEYRRQE